VADCVDDALQILGRLDKRPLADGAALPGAARFWRACGSQLRRVGRLVGSARIDDCRMSWCGRMGRRKVT